MKPTALLSTVFQSRNRETFDFNTVYVVREGERI